MSDIDTRLLFLVLFQFILIIGLAAKIEKIGKALVATAEAGAINARFISEVAATSQAATSIAKKIISELDAQRERSEKLMDVMDRALNVIEGTIDDAK